jgi:amino acid adenylation domain-containing protein
LQSAGLIEVLRARASAQPDRLAYLFLQNGEEEEARLTYGELDLRARALAARLQERGTAGGRALLLYPPGLEFIAAFFGCLCAEVVAVPAYPPRPGRGLDRLGAILADARPSVVLTTSALLERLRGGLAAAPELAGVEWLATDGSEAADPALAAKWREPRIDPGALAFLQYTSGSTASPKGVMVSHGNLLHNERMIQQAFGQSEDSVVVGWLPLYHDMGLIGTVLQPLWAGATCILMAPLAFLQRPARWLRAISRWGGTTSGGPDFAYALCVQRISAEERAGLDLSRWSVAFNGAEPVRAETMDRFAAAFAANGFRREAFFPCYGLAEGTLFVAGGGPGAGPAVRSVVAAELEAHRVVHAEADAIGSRSLVSCGRAWMEQRIEIVDPESGTPCAAGRVGEIWVSGPSVARGYWGQLEATERAFGARLPDGTGPFLRTGDLGFVDGGELFVTGRLKDLIILRGRNLYPHDVERTVEHSHPALRPGGGAAFSVDEDGAERLVVVHEVERRAGADVETVAAAVRAAVAAEHEAQVHAVVLLKAGSLPRTSSGKTRRNACRQGWLAGTLEVVGSSGLPSLPETAGGEPAAEGLEPYLLELAARVLRQAPPPLDQPLVQLGLDSVAAVELAHRVETDLGVPLPVARLLEGASLRELAAELLEAGPLGLSGFRSGLTATHPELGEHPASYGQRAFWFLERLAPESAALHVAAAARVRGDLDQEALRRAFSRLADRHAALRTTLATPGGEPVQVVHARMEPDWAVETVAGETELEELLTREAHRPFDLERGPLLRARLVRGPEGGRALLIAMHHSVTDLGSLAVLVRELGSLYAEETGGPAAALPPQALRYTDWTRWQRERMEGTAGERLWAWWSERLAGELPPLDLPSDRPRPAVQTWRGARRLHVLAPDAALAVRTLGRGHGSQGATLFTTLLAGYQALLHRYSGQSDLLVGAPAAGRDRPELADLAGYLVNMVVLRGDLGGDPSFEDLLGQARQTVLGALAHQDYPFALLTERLVPQRDPGRSPLFQAALVLQSAGRAGGEDHDAFGAFAMGHPGVRLTAGGLELESMPLAQRAAQFDLTLTAAGIEEGLALSLLYAADLFDAATAERMLAHFETLLRGAAGEPRRPLSDLPVLGAAEEAQLLAWGQGDFEPPAGRALHERFAAQAGLSPEAVAVVSAGEQLTYRELERRANQLAHHLHGLGVGPDALVGLCQERSLDLVVGALGILKAGGAYVPLDPAYPRERLAFLLEDSGTRVVVTREDLLDRLQAAPDLRTVCLDRDRTVIAQRPEGPPAGPEADLDGAAYLIYTSGSTGRPKGVVVTHRNAVRLLDSTRAWFGFGDADVWTLFHSFSFDFSVWELWGALLYGGRLVVVPYAVSRSPTDFHRLLQAEGVTVLCQTPSAFLPLIQANGAANGDEDLPALREVIFGGEALDPRRLRPWFDRHGDARPRLVNMYGITETTVHVTFRPLVAADAEGGAGSVLGVPIPDLQVRVLDRRLRPAPVGVPGEIHVGGAGLARGYHGRPELTAERFVPDPFARVPGARLYRSGDLARYRADGELEYLGRIDHQVKVRGFRIELGEIEAALLRHPAVREAAVLPLEGSLAAYLACGPGAAPGVSALRAWLAERLPDYMVPAAFVFLESLPLTAHGKLDRRALPAPGARPELEEPFAPPCTPVERALAAVWSEVLGVEQVGLDDNYFALGGDSIRSIKVQARAAERGLRLDFQDLFRFQTLRELAPVVAGTTGEATGTAPFALLTPEDRGALPEGLEDAYPLTRLMTGMIYQAESNPDYEVYVTTLHVRAPFDAAALQAAVDELVERHAILRTSFDTARFTQPLQLVHTAAELPVEVMDLRALPEAGRERELRAWIDGELRRRFDWARRPLARLHVHRRSEESFQLTLSEPFFDGWSVGSLLTELFTRYRAHLDGRPRVEPPLLASMRDFVALELAALASEETRSWWRQAIEGAPAGHLARQPAPPPKPGELPVRRHTVAISRELSDGLERLARDLSVPLKSVLLAAHVKVMSLFSGATDVLTGLLWNGRPEIADGERILGAFLNALCFRLRLRGESWEELVRSAFAAERELLPHRRYPLSELLGTRGGTPLFDSLFNFTHFHVYGELTKLPGVEVLDAFASDQTYYDLTAQFNQDHATSQIRLWLDHRTGGFGPGQIEAIGGTYLRVLSSMVAEPRQREDASPLLAPAERHQLLVEWNHRGAPEPWEGGLHELFERQAARTPDATALIQDGRTWSYREVDARSNRLARHLRANGFGGIGVESRAAVCLERSLDLVVAILAVLKAGGAYVPIDPREAPERLAYMLDDSEARVLLTWERLSDRISGSWLADPARTVFLDRAEGALTAFPDAGLGIPATADRLAFVIYTSGSTGRPKGVLGLHGPALHRFRWMWRQMPFAAGEVCCQKSFLSSVDSVWEVFSPMLQGVPSVLLSDAVVRDHERLLEALAGERVTRLPLVPSLLRLLLDLYPDLAERLPDLKYWICSGEALPSDLARRFAERMPGRVLRNLYGATEAASSAWYDVRLGAGTTGVPLGRPLGRQVYVLDSRLQPVPPGVPGQLAVGGPVLARGYLHHPDLTAQKFIPDPFGETPGGRLYLTGDLGRHRPDGILEILGRVDHQVQVRGFRVELGEIEAVLATHPGIRQVVVKGWDEAGETRLAAYVVAEGSPAPTSIPITAAELRDFLRPRLPEHMIPAAFVTMDALPLIAIGKVDRKALPPPAAEEGPGRDAAAPRTPTEEVVAGIWADVLGLERVGIHDDFYDLGGHSLLATQVVSRVRRALEVELPLLRLFETPTVAGLAEGIDAGRRGETLPRIVPVPRDGDLPLSFAQQRLCFLDGLTPGNPVYNLPGAVRLSGPLDVEALGRSLGEIARRHEALRTRFVTAAGVSRQVIDPELALPLAVVDLRSLPAAARQAEALRLVHLEARHPFDLARGPLLRARLLRRTEEESWFLLTLHHAVSDGWGHGVLVDELVRIYEAFAAGRPSPLPPLPVQYADFAAWQRQWLRGAALERQVDYWKQQLAGLPVLALPTDRPRPAESSHRGGVERIRMPRRLVDAARALCRREGASLFMTLLAAFEIVLHHASGQEELVVGTDLANRNLAETEGLIGFFVNQLVLRTDLSGDPTGRELLARVRRVALDAYAHQDLPFDRLVEILKPPRELNRTPLFQVKFVLQNAPRPPLRVSGLELERLELDTGTAKFDLLLNVWETEDGLTGALEHSTDLFDTATAARLLALWELALSGLAERPDSRLSELRQTLAAAEQERRRAQEEAWTRSSLSRFKSIRPRAVAVAAETAIRKERDEIRDEIRREELRKDPI